MARTWTLSRETPKANYPLQLLKDALSSMSERTSGVAEAHLIVAQVTKESGGGLLLATKSLRSACETAAARTGLSPKKQQSGMQKIEDAIKLMYRI